MFNKVIFVKENESVNNVSSELFHPDQNTKSLRVSAGFEPEKGGNVAEVDLWHPCCVGPSIVLLKNGFWDPCHEW
ncbi:hypothetical protein TNCV_1930081 [Trichonephila clavipes]|nr:hypothetical protein TNCV_1930081 [Trichonephila clavipes]